VTKRRLTKATGYGLAATFAIVGLIFVVIPARVLAAFNWLAEGLGWPVSTTQIYTLYLALALGYMYLVTILAWQMARHTQVRVYPWLLVQAKAASAIICLGLFALQDQYLLYLANFAVDGAIAVLVWWLCLRTVAGNVVGESSAGNNRGAEDSQAGPPGPSAGAGSATAQSKG